MNRILHIVGAMDRAGAETLIMNIYRQIDRSEFQFDFLVNAKQQSDYDEEILSLGGRITQIPAFTGLNLTQYKQALNQYLLMHPEYCIIHNHMTSTAYTVAKQAHKLDRRVVLHTHSQNFYSGFKHACFAISSFPLKFVGDYFLACSKEAAVETFGTNILTNPRYETLHNAIDLSEYHCTTENHNALKRIYGLNERPVFGHIGRFIPEKNHDFLLQSFYEVKKVLPNAILLLAGRGPLEEKTKAQTRALNIEDSVKFLGVCDNIAQLLKIVDVFVFPSINEGLGLAAIEAQAAGASCVLSTGVPELASVIFSKRISLNAGPTEWGHALIKAYDNSLVRNREEAREALANHGYDIVQVTHQLTNCYKKLLDNS